MEKESYDVVVIGAGSGGLTAAVGFAKIGKSVLLVEREHMGGECTNTGCVPSKAILHRAKEYYLAKHIAGKTTDSETYRQGSLTYVRDTINNILADETPETFKKIGIEVVMGEAIFNTECSIKVGETVYGYKTAIIATGSSPRMMTVPGLRETDTLTNQNLFDIETIPEKTLIIGAGPIGLEMGQALAMLGSKVTIAAIDSEFARLEDKSIRPILRRAFDKLVITIHFQAFISRVEDNVAIFDIKNSDVVVDEERVAFDKVLIAIGRVPNLPNGMEAAGIKFDNRCIMIDSQFRTSNKYVYAVGDVSQRLKFTHTADDTARQVVKRVASRGLLRVNKKNAVPKVTYTSPEVAQVGMSWKEAVGKYTEERLMRIEVPFSQNDRAKTDASTDGLLVVIARRLNGAVLGAHIIGASAGEIITTFTLAIDHKISLWKLQKLIYAYPTYSLTIKKAADQFFGRQMTDLKTDVVRLIKRVAPKLIAGIFWVALIYSFQHYRITNDLSYQDFIFQLLHFFTSTIWGPLVYMLLYAVRPLVLFPATLLTALSGALFGFWWGILYTILGENASANFAYWIGRFFGKDLRLEDSIIGNWIEALRKNSFETVLLMRLFYVPFDLTNYGSGIVRAKWSEYFFATLIGIMPGLTTFVALGASVDLKEFQMNGLSFNAFDPKFLTLSVVIFIVSLILSRNLKRWKAER
jgi:pyruvate/2-oxoglutarate dehydrogenase complex dihydrolipoamide dehydrogenase (E3) component/uncharacterized membrane protein YdjX (TVP38/TMEM64 family)